MSYLYRSSVSYLYRSSCFHHQVETQRVCPQCSVSVDHYQHSLSVYNTGTPTTFAENENNSHNYILNKTNSFREINQILTSTYRIYMYLLRVYTLNKKERYQFFKINMSFNFIFYFFVSKDNVRMDIYIYIWTTDDCFHWSYTIYMNSWRLLPLQ